MKKTLPLLILVIAVAGLAIYLTVSDDPFKSREIEQTDFVIEDTASVAKIVIADRSGRVMKLERNAEGGWLLNEKYPARSDAANLLLKTFKDVYIQRPVPKEGQEQVNTIMATGSKKVSIYNHDDELIKIWYVGHATMDKKGTYMLLETPDRGKSAAPFVMDMKGFIGMLNTRFFTDENEWRSTTILQFPEMNLDEIDVHYPRDERSDFRIEYGGENDIRLYSPEGKRLAAFDTSKVKDYMLNYKLLSFENFRTGLDEPQIDSVRSTLPYQIIKVSAGNKKHEIKLWPKKAIGDQYSEDEMDGMPLDAERVYASFNDGELALAQRFVWDRLRAPYSAFVEENNR